MAVGPGSAEVALPLLPLRNAILTPGASTRLFVGREASQRAVQAAVAANGRLVAVMQRDADANHVSLKALHDVGTVAEVTAVLKLPDGTLKVELAGLRLARLSGIDEVSGHLVATLEPTEATPETIARLGQPIVPPEPGERDDDVVEFIPFEGFDPEGDPELRVERGGSVWLVFNQMPPSWVPQEEYADFGRFATFGQELQATLGCDVLWDDREFFYIERPVADCAERIQRFLVEYRARHEPRR